ncbi:TMEM165/GDT1 family protein [Sandarakinorhabdus sp.]|uniref:TMEM165/GDT1 family protein n=1 Tax=Sandarakinorhabdus sp. TaxID=1916663 RepID=UPI00286DA73C|nr:TMEM165/GDT1 family protein [Sandarakinorhabdus sp.]
MSDFGSIVAAATSVVALAEIGDKTQLLAVVLAARFRAPVPIILGILAATLANHALAAWAGSALSGLFDGPVFASIVALGFIAMAGWTLVPDTIDETATPMSGRGAFVATAIAFFIAEIGDKTQVATVALGAQYHDVLAVTIGTTLGMMLANVPAVLLGEKVLTLVPLRTVRIAAAALFAGLGLWMLWGVWA